MKLLPKQRPVASQRLSHYLVLSLGSPLLILKTDAFPSVLGSLKYLPSLKFDMV